ncbi:MAG: T9SS type A sorting domain-containing protein [Saprospiraceae bacterium]|nr:T9SS type A sorting domain-containing protein [Saprospiraceae bacterium]
MYAAVFITDDEGIIVGGTKTDALYTSIDEIEVLENLVVFPNPAEDLAFLQMNLSSDAQVQISLVNMLGQTVTNRNYGNVSGSDISNWYRKPSIRIIYDSNSD